MNFKTLISILILSFLFSCKGSEAPSSNDKKEISTESVSESPSFTVIFYSEGEGIDGAAVSIFDDFISIYSTENETQLDYELITWGMEGELDYCFQLTSIEESSRKSFIQEVKKSLEGHRLIQYKENEPCRVTNR